MINPCMSPKSTNFKLGHVMERTNFGGKIGTILVILALQEDNFHLLCTPSPTTFSVRHQTQRFCYAQLFLLRTTFFCYAQLFLLHTPLRTTFSVTHNFFLLRTPLRTTFFCYTHRYAQLFLLRTPLRTTFSVTHTVTHNFFCYAQLFFCYAHRYAQLFFCYAHRYAQLFLLRTPLRTTFIDLVFGYACYACYSNYNWPKIMIFNKTGKFEKLTLKMDNLTIKSCSEYNYLGTIFQPSNIFRKARIELVKKARKSMFAFLKYVNIQNGAQPKTIMKLINSLVTPILLYNSEIWGAYVKPNQLRSATTFLKSLFDDNLPHEN